TKKTGEFQGPAIMEELPSVESPLIQGSTAIRIVVRDLVRLAKEQSYLTYDDINVAVPEAETDVDLLEELIAQLRAMKIRILDSAEPDALKSVSAKGTIDVPAADDDEEDDGLEKDLDPER